MECEYCSGSGRSIDLEMPGQDEVCSFCGGTGQTQHITDAITEHGWFSGPVKTEWVDNGRDMVILNHVSFTAPNGIIWSVYPGEIINGASIPRLFWRVVGSPYVGKYRRASAFHDVYCINRSRTWEAVHKVFKTMMLCDGVSKVKAETMYRAVRHFGPRW